MSEIMDFLRITIESIILAIGYPGIALIMFTENVFPPIPSELVMPFAGFLVARGEMTLVGILIAGTGGALLGAVALYYVGMWADEPLIRAFVRRWGRWFLVGEDDLDRALAFFEKYGEAVIFFGRLIPLIRSLVSIPAGMNRMNMPRFLGLTLLGTLIWNTFLGVAGMVLGQNWPRILLLVDRYEEVWLALMALGIIYFVVKRVMDMRQKGGELVTLAASADEQTVVEK